MQHRYHQLHLHAALSRRKKCNWTHYSYLFSCRYDYAQACKELAYILRYAYARAPKAVQLMMYQDALFAFRLLPRMDSFQQLSAAEVLSQAVDATLPRKRRASALSEYRQAAVIQHRSAKHQESKISGDFLLLSTDVLLHIFGFLDVRSLAMCSAVCRSWNEASNCDMLWRTHFLDIFGSLEFDLKCISSSPASGSRQLVSRGARDVCWHSAFSLTLSHRGCPSRLFLSNRAFCMGCKSMVWLTKPYSMAGNADNCMHPRDKARPVTVAHVLGFVLGKQHSASSSSSSDSETDEEFKLERNKLSRLWAYPRLNQSHSTG